jgi:large subunit ribosomal protein L15
MKIKKRKKNLRMRGGSSHGWGARKKHKKSGHRGGSGMAGTGKRADQKKTLINKLYGHKYFGKQGITSKKTQKDKTKKINLRDIEEKLKVYVLKKIAVKKGDSYEVDLSKYKILGEGEVKMKMMIKAKSASKSAVEKVRKFGGEILLEKK